MRTHFRCAVALVVAACLASLPAMAATNRALGYVVLAQGAQLDGNNALNGTNVYSGDALETEPGGTLRVQIAANQVYLFGASTAKLSGDDSASTTLLISGTAGFSSVPGSSVAIRALDVTIRPKTAEATHAQVTVNGPEELLVTSYRGALELELDGKTYSMAPGSSYKVDVGTSDTKQMNAGNHVARNQRGLVLLVFGGTAAAYTGLVIYHELHESPEKP